MLSRSLLTTFLLALAPAVATAEIWDKAPFSASASDLRAAADKVPVADAPAVVILLESGTLRLDDEGRATYAMHRIYKVTSADGVSGWASTGSSWAPWFQDKPKVRARVVTSDGREHKLAQSALIEDKAPSGSDHTYSDRRSVRAPLPSIAIGSIVEEEIVTTNHARYFAGGEAHSFFVGSPLPWHRARFVVDAPRKLKVKTLTRNVDGVVRRTKRSGDRVIETFSVKDIAPMEPFEQFLPADVRRYRRITASIGSWKAMAGAYSDIVDRAIAAGPIPELIAKARANASANKVDLVAAALALVSDNIRYTGLELGESAIVPFSPAETWQRKYGDCKDKATLLVALLRGVGLDAHVAIIESGYGENLEPTMPGLDHFNHAIVAVTGKGAAETLWIDPTEELAGVGVLPQSDQGRYALIARPSERAVLRTPIASSLANTNRELRRVELPEFGPARIVEKTTLAGERGVAMRRYVQSNKPSEVKTNLEAYLKGEYEGAKLVNLKHTGPTEALASPFELELVAKDPGMATAYRDDARVRIDTTRLLDRLPDALTEKIDADEKPRKSDLFFFPFVRELAWTIEVPDGFDARDLPAQNSKKVGPATLATVVAKKGSQVRLTLRLDLGSGRFSPSEVLAFRKEVAERDQEIEVIIDQVGMRHLAGDRLAEAATEIRRLIALHPKEALHRVQLSNIYLEAGLGEPARKLAIEALKVEPRSADAHGWLGYVYGSDSIGRWAHPGADIKKAIAATKKGVELAPSEVWIHGNLALLYELDDQGRRYRGDLEKAREAYLALKKATGSTDRDDDFRALLVRANRWKEALELARTMDTAEGHATRLAATMMLEGLAGVKRELRQMGADRAAQREALNNAHTEIVGARSYAKAVSLTEFAIDKGYVPKSEQSKLEVTKSIRRVDSSGLDDTKIEDLALRFLDVIYRGDSIAILVDNAKDFADEVETIFDPSGFVPGALLDVVASMLKNEVDELPGWGWRLSARTQGPNLPTTSLGVFFVKKRRGALKIFASCAALDPLAREAARLVDANKLAMARHLLDWIVACPNASGLMKDLWKAKSNGAAAEIRIGAASAMSEKSAAQAISLLGDCSGSKPGTEDACQRALAVVLFSDRSFARAAEVLDSMLAKKPDDRSLKTLWLMALAASGKATAAKAAIAAIEKGEGRTIDVVRAEGAIATILSNLDDTLATFVEISKMAETEPSELNMLVWLSLFKGNSSTDNLGIINGVLGKDRNSAFLNTAAALYAHRGSLSAAREALVESLGRKQATRPQDLVVLGRIAATLGLEKEARDYYKKASVGAKPSDSLNAPGLAKVWLKDL